VTASTIQCFAGAVSCDAVRGDGIGSPYEFSRTANGWAATPLAPSATQFPAITPWSNSPDTGAALFSIPTAPGSEDDFYVREPDGSFVHMGPETPPALGPASDVNRASEFESTTDYSHFAWEMKEDEWPFDGSSTGTVYEYMGRGNAQPLLVGVSGGRGSTDQISACRTSLGTSERSGPWGMSSDGRVVFFKADSCPSGTGVNSGVPVLSNELWARIEESRTVLISGRSPGDCTGSCLSSTPTSAEFAGASKDGSKAFFVSSQRLMDSATEGSANLYEYDFDNPAGHNLIDVSAGDTSGGGPRVGRVEEISTDGSHVYFIAQGVLTGAANEFGQVARSGANNLYVFERDAAYPQGHIAFITTLSARDVAAANGFGLEVGGVHANVTPDGRFLVFTSSGDLTPDDTSTSGARQVFRYDAQTGQLIRLSIGEQGFGDNGNRFVPTACRPFGCAGDAAIAPAGPTVSGNRSDPTMSNDGSYVFFTSPVGLTPGALDEVNIGENLTALQEGFPHVPVYAQNVYEWHEGRVSLISDGRDSAYAASFGSLTDVQLIGSDASGANVFFTTSDALVPQDVDTELDIYDARVCTASEPCPSPPAPPAECSGEGCHGVPAGAPGALGVGSVAFSGPGNIAQPAAAPAKHKAKARPKAKPKKRRRHRARRATAVRRSGRGHARIGGGR
jgi:hypothetical protein